MLISVCNCNFSFRISCKSDLTVGGDIIRSCCRTACCDRRGHSCPCKVKALDISFILHDGVFTRNKTFDLDSCSVSWNLEIVCSSAKRTVILDKLGSLLHCDSICLARVRSISADLFFQRQLSFLFIIFIEESAERELRTGCLDIRIAIILQLSRRSFFCKILLRVHCVVDDTIDILDR